MNHIPLIPLISNGNKAFTLIELIIVIAIIGLLAAALFMALDPATRIADTKNAVRDNNSVSVKQAIERTIADNRTVPANLNNLTDGTYYMIVTEGGSTAGTVTCTTPSGSMAKADVVSDFENNIASMPVDDDASGDDTGYYIKRTGSTFVVGYCSGYSAVAAVDSLIGAVFGDGSSLRDYFYSVDSDGSNIYAVGSTPSEGAGGADALIVKADALIVKFDSDLNIVARKIYPDFFNGIHSDGTNVYAVGYTYSEGAGGNDALIVKFNSDLSIAARKVYGGSSSDLFKKAYTDGTNIYAVGWTNSEGVSSDDALIVKFNSDLSIAARKIYGGSSWDFFEDVFADGTDAYITGGTYSEGAGDVDCLILKLNSSDLSIDTRKVYGGSAWDKCHGIHSDGSSIYVVGETISHRQDSFYDGLMIKLDTNLALQSEKVYSDTLGTIPYQYLNAADYDGAYVWSTGYSEQDPWGDVNGMLLRVNDFPSGNLITDPVGFGWNDISLTLANSALTLANSALTLANSAMTLSDSALTLADSALTQTIYTIE